MICIQSLSNKSWNVQEKIRVLSFEGMKNFYTQNKDVNKIKIIQKIAVQRQETAVDLISLHVIIMLFDIFGGTV